MSLHLLETPATTELGEEWLGPLSGCRWHRTYMPKPAERQSRWQLGQVGGKHDGEPGLLASQGTWGPLGRVVLQDMASWVRDWCHQHVCSGGKVEWEPLGVSSHQPHQTQTRNLALKVNKRQKGLLALGDAGR